MTHFSRKKTMNRIERRLQNEQFIKFTFALGCIWICQILHTASGFSSSFTPSLASSSTFRSTSRPIAIGTFKHSYINSPPYLLRSRDIELGSNKRHWKTELSVQAGTEAGVGTKLLKEDDCKSGESCSLDHHDDEDLYFLNSMPITSDFQNTNSYFNPVMMIPILTPFLAYMTYDDVARGFNFLFNILALERSWNPVDGGAYQSKIIAPAINGIVVPSISILFATLTSNTVSSLRQRQIDIHSFLNTEAGDLRMLHMLVDSYPDCGEKFKCREYLKQYTCRLIAESVDVKMNKAMLGSTDSEMNGFVAALNEMAVKSESTTEKTKTNRPADTILSESYSAVIRLNSTRSCRLTALQCTFPVLHYGILGILAASICVTFLLETNQELLIFLNAIQLRILWTMLMGSISALAVICWDLTFPFTGSYIISNAVDQLKTIRDMIKAVTEVEGQTS